MPRDGGLADAEPLGDFDLGELGGLADHGQVHGVGPVLCAGLASRDEVTHMVTVARALHPVRPGGARPACPGHRTPLV